MFPTKCLNFRASINGISGYGRLIRDILTHFPRLGIEIKFIPLDAIPEDKKEDFEKYFSDRCSYNLRDPELLMTCPCNEFAANPIFRLNPHSNRTLFTMWESTNCSFNFIEEMNKMKKVLVPNHYNKFHFERQGVNVPVEVLPLYVDTSIFKPIPKSKDKFIFGTGNKDPRKRIDRTISNFRRAFPKERDVALKIKISPNDTPFYISDDRIEVCHSNLNSNELADWYRYLDVFVSSVSAEGWGMMQSEAMACGVPVIATKYAGLEEYFNEDNGFVVPHKEVPAEGYWGLPGAKWSDFKDSDFIELMRVAYNNQHLVKTKGNLAVSAIIPFTLERYLKGLLKHCFEP
jgi:glycosyltransferase involved in cell wall biosynthesis